MRVADWRRFRRPWVAAWSSYSSRSDLSMWCNDEGLLNGAAWNPVATLLAISFGVRVRLHGPVVFTGGADAEGATLPLTDRQLFVLAVACDSIREDLAGGVS